MAKIIFAFLAILILIPSLVAAIDEVKIAIGNSEIHGNVGEIRKTNVTITNNENMTDTFSLTVFPQYWFGVSAALDKYVLTLPPKSTDVIELSFSIPACVDKQNQEFRVTAKSLSSVFNATNSTVLRVEGPVCISAVIVENPRMRPDNQTLITTIVSNVADNSFSQYRLQTQIKSDTRTLKTFDQVINYLGPKSQTQINFTFTPEKYTPPGNYSVISTLSNNIGTTISTNSKNVIEIVPTYDKPTISKSTGFGLLFSTVTLTVKNENNVPVSDFVVVETVPGFAKGLSTTITNTSEIKDLPDKVEYTWQVSNLQPGEERLIKYQFNLQNIIIVVVALAAVIIVAFNFVFSPQINKNYRVGKSIAGEREIIISIDVRNRSRHEMRDVIVRDFLPSIMNVVEKFDTVKPMIRRAMNGTELIWKFDLLKPFEERVITYRARPSTEVIGAMKLPNAHIKYLDKKQQRKVVLSKGVMIR
ncbi:MAG: hypothetical protein J4452_04275 [Candidatus Aenigmarchaeota archaeon]|nr:hypothetical protein [Candidatus Aenigmarchaeota archaeon]